MNGNVEEALRLRKAVADVRRRPGSDRAYLKDEEGRFVSEEPARHAAEPHVWDVVGISRDAFMRMVEEYAYGRTSGRYHPQSGSLTHTRAIEAVTAVLLELHRGGYSLVRTRGVNVPLEGDE